MRAYIHKQGPSYIYIYIYIYVHIHTYIHIYIHTYIHTYTLCDDRELLGKTLKQDKGPMGTSGLPMRTGKLHACDSPSCVLCRKSMFSYKRETECVHVGLTMTCVKGEMEHAATELTAK
jgi:hypothetical protein